MSLFVEKVKFLRSISFVLEKYSMNDNIDLSYNLEKEVESNVRKSF